jgi:hypothetical protein
MEPAGAERHGREARRVSSLARANQTPYNSKECLSNRSSKFHRIRIFHWKIFPSAFSNRDKANRVWALRLGI